MNKKSAFHLPVILDLLGFALLVVGGGMIRYAKDELISIFGGTRNMLKSIFLCRNEALPHFLHRHCHWGRPAQLFEVYYQMTVL